MSTCPTPSLLSQPLVIAGVFHLYPARFPRVALKPVSDMFISFSVFSKDKLKMYIIVTPKKMIVL